MLFHEDAMQQLDKWCPASVMENNGYSLLDGILASHPCALVQMFKGNSNSVAVSSASNVTEWK